jgi:hypothetical protein
MFNAPIPGQSLTTEPRNNPWENPAEMSDVGDVIKYYVNKLADDEVMDDLAAILDQGIAVKTIVVGMYRAGVMNGLHTVDAGILAAPAIHAFIRAAVKEMGIDVKDDSENLEKRITDKEKDRFNALVIKYMSQGIPEDEGTAFLEEISGNVSEEPMPQSEEPMPEEDMVEEEETVMEPEEAPMGLMARGV